MKRRDFLSAAGAGAALAAAGGLTPLLEACGRKGGGGGRKVIVLAIDGMDPTLTRRFVAQGLLPNFARFIERNTFMPLGTSLPPQSPVAWSDFITGAGSGVHGIYDFIARDPRTLTPFLSISRAGPPKKNLSLGSLRIPLSGAVLENLRRGPCLWQLLDEGGVPAVVFKCPSNFPPVKTDARTVSGMGTPDMRGTYGTFSYYTDDPPADAAEFTGGECFAVRLWDNSFTADLTGPDDTFHEGGAPVRLPLTVWRDPVSHVAKIKIGGHEVVLNAREWTGWLPIKFPMLGGAAAPAGMIRMYLKEVHPHLRLYVSPIHIDPLHPALPISTPTGYAGDLARAAGRFHTKGFPEDTKALSHGVLTDEEYLVMAREVMEEDLRVMDHVLRDYDDGFLYFYFSCVDQNTHMMWRTMDTAHPLYDPNAPPEVKGAVAYFYRRMDEAFGRVLAKVDARTTFLCISDHGFAPFYREFNLNTWLLDHGYLALVDPGRRAETEFLDNVDWPRTRAYGLGLNGLYLNLRGREGAGSVAPSAAPALVDEIAAQLEGWVDPATGQTPVSRAYKAREWYRGPEVSLAPDIVVGFRRGWRMGDDSATGEFPAETTKIRKDKWAGDHCIDPRFVPGVLFSNRPLLVPGPNLRDLAPTILRAFGLPPARVMTGRNLLG